MLSIFANQKLNKHANDYFLMFFKMMNDNIEISGNKSAFMDIFPKHLVIAELKKCKMIYNEIYSWVADEFLHNDFRPIHEYVLYSLLEIQTEIESANGNYNAAKEEKLELEKLRKTLSEAEREYLDNINNAGFYLGYLFEDNDFMHYENFYNTFGTEVFSLMRYDERIIELLPKDKRKEIKKKMKEAKIKEETYTM